MHVFTPEPMPLAVAGPDAAARLTRDMERQGIQVHTGTGGMPPSATANRSMPTW